MANDRVSQLPVEAVVAPTSQKARVSQEPVEAVVAPTNQKARLSQEPVEAVIAPTSQKARLSQAVVEVVISGATYAADADLTIDASVSALVDKDLALDYSVRTLVDEDLGLDYVVRMVVGQDLGVDYVIGSPHVDLTVDPAIAELVHSDLGVDYVVESSEPVAVAGDLAIEYAINPTLSKEYPTYHGGAQAIHVRDGAFSVAPARPSVTGPTYPGTSPAIRTMSGSPEQTTQASTDGGRTFEDPYYHGRSQAIHVFGDDVSTFPPVDPIPSCVCDSVCSCGITDTMGRTVAEVVGPVPTAAAIVGVTDSGPPWMVQIFDTGAVRVADPALEFRSYTPGDGSGSPAGSMVLTYPNAAVLQIGAVRKFEFSISELPSSVAPAVAIVGFDIAGGVSASVWINSDALSSPEGLYSQSNIGFGTPGVITAEKTLIPNSFWSVGTRYRVEQWDTGTTNVCKLIAPGGASVIAVKSLPATTKTLVNRPSISFQRDLNHDGAPVHPEIVFRLFDVDIPEIDVCTMDRLSTFIQLDASSWGGLTPSRTSWTGPGPDSPLPVAGWTNEVVSGATPSVSPGLAKVLFTGALGEVLESLIDATAPWADGSVTLTLLYRMIGVGETRVRVAILEDTFAAFRVFDFNSVDNTVAIDTDTQSASVSLAEPYEDSVLYFAKVEIERGVACRAKAWSSGVFEPADWDVEVPDDGSALSTPHLRIESYGEPTDSITYVYVDIDYPDKRDVCSVATTESGSEVCAELVVDDFTDRSIASSGPWAEGDEVFGMPSADEGAVAIGPWVTYNTGSSSQVGDTIVVDGVSFEARLHMTRKTGLSGLSDWDVVLPSASNSVLDSRQIVLRAVFKVDHVGSGAAEKFDVRVSLAFGLLLVNVNDTAGPTYGGLTLDTGSGPTAIFAKTDWVADTWYNADLSLDYDTGAVQARVYPHGDSPPAYQVSTTRDVTVTPAASSLHIGGRVADTGHDLTISWLYVTADGCFAGSGCTDCSDPENPGFQLPAFTPGFMPTFRRQIGDPTTNLDGFICTFESGAMVLDWHTRGAVKVWGGELIPWSGRTEASIRATGSNLTDVQRAWRHWGQYLDIRSGQTWADLVACLTEGRAVILQGDYGAFSLAERCQDNFEENHAISVYPYQVSDRILVGDPLCHTFLGVRAASLQSYAETLGAVVYGATSPQRILFAVSRPWTP